MGIQVPTRGGILVELPGLAVDGARALAVLRKITRGIYFRARPTIDVILVLPNNEDVSQCVLFRLEFSQWLRISG